MAFPESGSVFFPHGFDKCLDGTLDFLAITKKIMIVDAAPDGDEEFVSELSEITTAGYTGGFAGASRLTASGAWGTTVNVSSLTDLRLQITYSQTHTWVGLGTTNDTTPGLVIIHEITNDADSIPLIWLPFEEAAVLDGGSESWSPGAPITEIGFQPPESTT